MPRSYTPPGYRPPTSGPSGSPATLAAFAAVTTAVVAVTDPAVATVVAALTLAAVPSVAALVIAVALVRVARLPRRAAVPLPRSNLRLEVALSRRE